MTNPQDIIICAMLADPYSETEVIPYETLIREKKNHLLKIIFIFIVLFSSSLYAAISTVYLVMIYNLEEPIRKIKINEKEVILENELE